MVLLGSNFYHRNLRRRKKSTRKEHGHKATQKSKLSEIHPVRDAVLTSMRPQSFSLASSRADVLALWPWNCTAARWEPWLSNIRWRPSSSFQGQNQIFLSAAPVQGRKEILGIRRGERGRREQQSSLVWTDSGSWKPVFERYIAQFKGKVETKRWPWGCFLLMVVMWVVIQCQLHSSSV